MIIASQVLSFAFAWFERQIAPVDWTGAIFDLFLSGDGSVSCPILSFVELVGSFGDAFELCLPLKIQEDSCFFYEATF